MAKAKVKILILLFLFSVIAFLTPTSVKADTLVNTFRITDEGSQQKDPMIFQNIVAYDSLSDIWGYNLDTKVNYPILQKPGQQYLTGFSNNRIVYEDVDDVTQASDVHLHNILNGRDFLIAGGPGSQTSGVTNGSVVVYIDGGACGTLNLYKISSGETMQIFPNTCHPVRMKGNIVVFPVTDVNGTNIKGYYIDTNQLFDIATDDGFQEVPSVWDNKVIWLHRLSGGYGDYNAIKTKNLKTGVVKTIYESSTDALNWPAISGQYAVWSQSSSQHVGGVRGSNLNTGETFEVQEQGPHQNSHTMPAIWKNTTVWQAWRTGNGDIYGSTLSPLLNEKFNGPTLNTKLWEFFITNGGNYSFDNGSIVVPGGPSMFYIRTKNNPFPISGPFSVEFGIQYTSVDESGIGVALGFEQQDGYNPDNVPVAYWQGSNFGLQVVRFGLTVAVIGGNPDLNYHVGKISYDGEKYIVYLDGILKYTSPPSATAKTIWFGNPFCCRSNWTGFKLDYIKVTTP